MILERKILILGTATLLSFFVVIQINSFDNVNDTLQRDSKSNIFQEIKILKEKNEDLKSEISDLESAVGQLNDQGKALNAIQEEITEYTKLSGKASVFGPGVTMTIDGKFSTPWMIDMVNELFNSGAQAVSVNGIRIVNQTAGFDTLPKGQILLNGSVLSSPYTVNAIGEATTLFSLIQSPGGIFDRLKKAFPATKTNITTKDIIQMD
ncbi:DUF881 domain-containing protein [Candidatus Gracilibacteria bacterium]|nr:DUF881 domain-containing protein [Candidatus Gracilibacteria bacterium]